MVNLVWRCFTKHPIYNHSEAKAKDKAKNWRNKNESNGLHDAAYNQRLRAGFYQGCADEASDKGMRRTRGKTKIPGKDIPTAGAYKCSKDDTFINKRYINDTFA
jgi:hypothetical protein